MRIQDFLSSAKAQGVARLDALALLEHHLGQGRSWLLAHDQDELALAPAAQARLSTGLQRRAAEEPLAYLVGHKEFHGLRLAVSPAVLIPRPETELLVDWALALCRASQTELPSPKVVDLGTGSGAVALAIKAGFGQAQLTATDCSGAALAVAQANGASLGLAVDWRQGSWWQALAAAGAKRAAGAAGVLDAVGVFDPVGAAAPELERVDLAVSNPPYIASGDVHLSGLSFEPMFALTPGSDGLDALRAIVRGAPAHLKPGAWLLLEHGHDQAAQVRQLLLVQGFGEVQTREDLAGLPRCTGGRLQIDKLGGLASSD